MASRPGSSFTTRDSDAPHASTAAEIVLAQRGQPNGLAPLDATGKVPAAHLPPVASGGVAAPKKQAVAVSRIPAWVNGTYHFTGSIFHQPVHTDGNSQYVAWINDARSVIIAKRDLSRGLRAPFAQTFDLGTIAGNPLGTPVNQDFHTGPYVTVDSTGRIIVAANVHAGQPGNTFRAVRSTNPGDITAWTDMSAAVPQFDNTSSYPAFVKFPVSGKLIMFMRHGGSGNADTYLYEQTDAAANTWVRRGKIFDGVTNGESMYPNTFAVDPKTDRLHFFHVWRGSATGPDSNNDPSYAYTDDFGATWKKSDGSTIPLPIVHGASEVLLDTAATGSGLLNNCGAAVDTKGRPHAAFLIKDTNGHQYVHWYRDTGGVWHQKTLTTFTHSMDLSDGAGILAWGIARPTVVRTADGRVYVIGRTQYDGRRGSAIGFDVTPDDPAYGTEFVLHRLDLHDWEACIDTSAMYARDELHTILCPVKTAGASSPAEYNDATQWQFQLAVMGSYDLAQMPQVAAGEARVPRIEPLQSQGAPTGTAVTTTSTTTAVLTGVPQVTLTPQDHRGSLLVARAKVRGNVQAGSGTFRVKPRATLGETPTATSYLAVLPYTGANTTLFTPWVPIRAFDSVQSTESGFVTFEADVDTGVTGRVTRLQIDVGQLVV